MKIAPLLAVLALPIIAPPAPAADLTPEQQELLAWATTLRYQARVEQAMAVCEMIVATNPGCVEAWIEHGILALSESRFEEASEDFLQALRRDARNPMALVGRGHLYLAQGDRARAVEDASKALDVSTRAIDRDRATAETWYARGLAKMLLEDGSALQDFVMAVSLERELMDAHTERAEIYRARGRTQDAIDQLTRAVGIRPDYAVGYLARARVHFEAQDFDAALADCDRALEINPQYARAWHNRGLINLQQEEVETAIEDLSEAISADPEYASAHVYRAQAYIAFGNTAAARADLERAKELEPDGWAGTTADKLLPQLGGTPGG